MILKHIHDESSTADLRTNFFNSSGRDRRSRDRFLAAREEDKDVLTLCEKRIYLFVLIFEMLFRLVSNLQSPCLCCFKIRLLDVMKSSGLLCSTLTLWFRSGTLFPKLYFFLHVLLKCFPIKVILYLPCNNVLLHCCKYLLFLCKDKACVNTDTIVLELWPHPHRGL